MLVFREYEMVYRVRDAVLRLHSVVKKRQRRPE